MASFNLLFLIGWFPFHVYLFLINACDEWLSVGQYLNLNECVFEWESQTLSENILAMS